jgi:hypothetical protein
MENIINIFGKRKKRNSYFFWQLRLVYFVRTTNITSG